MKIIKQYYVCGGKGHHHNVIPERDLLIDGVLVDGVLPQGL